jgi:hypothetical protein
VEQILGALILAAGALFGVRKGAVYATDRLVAQLADERERSDKRLDAEAQRLEVQLNAERDRFTQQLDAEAVRHGAQLRHDREMRDLEEMRAKLDGVTIDMRRVANLVINLQAIVQMHGRADDNEHELRAVAKVCRAMLAGFDDLHKDLNDGVLSMYLRLLPGHPVVKASESFLDTATKIVNLFRGDSFEMQDARRVEFFSLRDRLWDFQAEFVAASLVLVGMLETTGAGFPAPKSSSESE